MQFKRVFLVVLDSLGIGEASDAAKFGDVGANTLGNIVKNVSIEYPALAKMGLLNLIGKKKVTANSYYMKGIPLANGKDTLTGHLEIMGIRTIKPFKTFTETGFPDDLINELEKRTGRKIIGNCNASGTEIIERLGEEQIKTGALIVYTSADSVLQIAAHEDIIPLPELYKACEIARELTLKDEWKVGRIIARPYTGKPGEFVRTANRHDYALDPESETILDKLKNNNYEVISIGKIVDIYNGCGITKSIRTTDNMDGINKILKTMSLDFTGLCFANLNDFDSKYGHRRDAVGYAKAIKQFNNYLVMIQQKLKHDDLLIITADHGNDPTFKGTDHTRENVPVLVYSKSFNKPKRLNDLTCLSDIGSTIADNFNIPGTKYGESFLDKLV